MGTSRVEVAEHIAEAFQAGLRTREQLVAAARDNAASDAVVDQLQRLPQTTFRSLRGFWPQLPGLPVEPADARI